MYKGFEMIDELEISQNIWEKFPEETNRAFGAFVVYRNMPAHKRSIQASVKELYDEVAPGKLRQMQKWSSMYSWVARAGAWDKELDREARQELLKQVKDANVRHIKLAQAMQQKAIERLKTMQAIELSVRDVLDWIVNGAKIERLTLGEPEEITQIKGELGIIDYSRMSTEELNALMAQRVTILPDLPLPISLEEEEEEEDT